MLQDKHIVLQRDEVQVLIVNFMNVGNTAWLQRCRRQVLQLLPRNRRDKVEMVNVIKAVLEVLCDSPEIFLCRRAEVDCWNVGNRVAIRVQLTKMRIQLMPWFHHQSADLHVKSATQIPQLLHRQQRWNDVLSNAIINKKLPHRLGCESFCQRLIQVQHLLDCIWREILSFRNHNTKNSNSSTHLSVFLVARPFSGK